MSIKVFGHLSPDTDSTCTPIVYTWFWNQINSNNSKEGNTDQADQSAQPLVNSNETNATAVLWGEPNKEALYLLERFGIEKPAVLSGVEKGEKVVIIDTNNADELPESILSAEILQILDHHKLFGNLSTESPIKVNMQAVACSATIVYQEIESAISSGLLAELPENMASLLLGAIISDTLKFTSPTTTKLDREVAEKLAQNAKIDIDELAEKMFAAKSDLTGMSAKDILLVDSKVFDFVGKRGRISVLETTNPSNAQNAELITEMQNMKQQENLEFFLFYIVDIINSNATLLLASDFEKDVARKAHNVEIVSDSVLLAGVVSRKKQIAPEVERAMS